MIPDSPTQLTVKHRTRTFNYGEGTPNATLARNGGGVMSFAHPKEKLEGLVLA